MVKLGNDWDRVIGGEFEKDYYLKLREFLKKEYSLGEVYPNMYDMFSALKVTSFEDTKVVIIGQDPYHEPGQAHGMAFSVKPGVPVPPSLMNMYKELNKSLGCFIPNNGFLMPWAKQGVLLLNAVLTVRRGQADSHKGKGWEQFTDSIIEALNRRRDPVVFLLWGNNARKKADFIDRSRHFVFEAPHPSPLSASRGFFGCNHFAKANEALISILKSPIDWQIPNI